MSSEKGAATAYNFLINASNQANLAGTQSCMQRKLTCLCFSNPYYIDRFNLAGLDLISGSMKKAPYG